MKALVFRGPDSLALEDRPRPKILEATDAVVRITTTTICGTNLHILKGGVPTIADGRVLGHEGVGIVEETGTAVRRFHKGDKVLISLITSCGRCGLCRKGMFLPLSRRRLAAGQQHRGNPGRIRQDPFCG